MNLKIGLLILVLFLVEGIRSGLFRFNLYKFRAFMRELREEEERERKRFESMTPEERVAFLQIQGFWWDS